MPPKDDVQGRLLCYSSVLTIKNVASKDFVMYQCHFGANASTRYGRKQSEESGKHINNITVFDARTPLLLYIEEVMYFESTYIGNPGSKILMQCLITGGGTLNWYISNSDCESDDMLCSGGLVKLQD